jgi:hypothetical protein
MEACFVSMAGSVLSAALGQADLLLAEWPDKVQWRNIYFQQAVA